MNYKESLDYLNQLSEFKFDFGLDRISHALRFFSYPDKKYPSFIVGGTNGKGSTVSYLSEIIQESGQRVGTFTSPHLSHLTERIQINSTPISSLEFSRILSQVSREVQATKIPALSYFETCTLVAALYFYDQNVDCAIFEVGLGGRLDACNALTHEISILTKISMDHMEYLGNTLEEIVFEKLAITQKTPATIIGLQSTLALQNIEAYRKKHNLNFEIQSQDFKMAEFPKYFSYQSRQYSFDSLQLKNNSQAHRNNATLALRAAEEIIHPLDEKTITQAFLKTRIPGRMETWAHQKIDKTAFIDVAHNIDSIENLISYIQQEEPHYKNVLLSMQKDKDWKECVEKLSYHFSYFYFTLTPTPRTWDLDEVSQFSKNLNLSFEIITDAKRALPLALRSSKSLVVCGSFYLIGPVREELEKNQFILQ